MINKRNVLILSAGRRVELLLAFKTEIKERGLCSHVFTTDQNPKLSSACNLADHAFATSKVTEEGYIDRLLKICEEAEVGLVIPTIDTELLSLAQAKSRFAENGIHIVISDEDLIIKCRDKRQTSIFFSSLGIDSPKLLDRSQLTFPCFVKPYDGSRSIGAAKITQLTDLTESMRNDSKLIFMEYIDRSFEEYSIDAYFDKRGFLRCLVPRHRLEVRDGEISKGVTRKNYVYNFLLDRLKNVEGARGCLTLQLFFQPDEQRFAALEINPRFGGGYPLSYASGAKYPGWLLDEYLLNREVPFFDGWENDLLMLRYDAQVIVHNAI